MARVSNGDAAIRVLKKDIGEIRQRIEGYQALEKSMISVMGFLKTEKRKTPQARITRAVKRTYKKRKVTKPQE